MLNRRLLLGLVVLGALAGAFAYAAGDVLPAALVRILDLTMALGLLSAVLLFFQKDKLDSRGPTMPSPAEHDARKPLIRFSRIRINAHIGFAILGLGATAMFLAGVPETIVVAFVSTGMVILKDIIKADADYFSNLAQK